MSAHVTASQETADTARHGSTLATAFEEELADFLAQRERFLLGIDPDLGLLYGVARDAVLNGGKRLRPTFAYWGWRAALPLGAVGEPAFIRAAASLELLHACALVHDDVMDSSETRRGRPAAHVRFAAEHAERGWPADATGFGRSGAILLGDLLLSWAEEMFTEAIGRLPAGRCVAAQAQFDLMRTEVVAGQFLDVLAQTRGAFNVDEALRVIEFKTSKYTVERPLLLGAAAAAAPSRVSTALAAYGHALGEAFQLRDDLLGVFGDPELTGKPAGDDLREGKRTVLVAHALDAASDAQREIVESLLGRDDLELEGVEAIRQVLVDTGAVDRVEDLIRVLADEANRALDLARDTGSYDAPALDVLEALVAVSTARQS
jgi:geranylgeranyl diphosphate synthase type I